MEENQYAAIANILLIMFSRLQKSGILIKKFVNLDQLMNKMRNKLNKFTTRTRKGLKLLEMRKNKNNLQIALTMANKARTFLCLNTNIA